MNWVNLLADIFEVCLIPLLGVLTTYLIQYIRLKGNEAIAKIENEKADKYIEMLTNTIETCVLATNQTYVDALKKANGFGVEEQKVAFEKTFEKVLSILTEESKKYLTEAVGDLDVYITEQIEAAVKQNKVWD